MKRWTIGLTLLLIILGTSACGGKATPAAAPVTSEPAATATPTPEPPTPTPQPATTEEPTATPEPSPTPEPVSPLSTPAVQAPAAQPEALPTPGMTPVEACTETLSGAEESIGTQVPELGCPLAAPQFVFMARQPFQHGQMIWRSDEQIIYALHEDGTWQAFADTFQEGMPESDPAITPPENLFQPIRGFGKVWREQLGGPAAPIGWATEPEAGVNGNIQAWQNGVVVSFGFADRFVLLNDGTWQKVK